ncbi:MAG: arginine--tRNA ligase [Candidatus Woesearchaeota archaeon]
MDDFVKAIASALRQDTLLSEEELSKLIEVPPSPDLGDYAFPCFKVSAILKKSPQQIAFQLQGKLKIPGIETKANGAYLNFFVDKEALARKTIEAVLNEKDNYGAGKENSRIVIEYPSPNTNKPLHLGHVRNMLLGKSCSRLLAFQGNKVITVCLNNDRGVHICKAMLAYKLWGNNKEPDKKPDHFVGDFYVLYSKNAEQNPELEQQVREMLQKWEKGDKETIALWKKINGWALEGFDETYKKFGIKFDKVYNESEHYEEGKQIVLNALKKGLLAKDGEGNIVAELEKYSLPNKILLRADGTSIYMTQDINLAKLKFEDFKPDISIYVVGSEQNLHFRQLFKILEILGVKTGKCHHLAYGMVYLPEGKMKSREGRVVDADDLVAEIISLSREEMKKRHALNEEELEKRSRQIGMAAISFFILKYDTPKDFVFNAGESIALEGETGPYIQYTHARICSIFKKFSGKLPAKADYSKLNTKEEHQLVSMLSKFPKAAKEAADSYKPMLVARYLLDLCQLFNNFYHQYQVLNTQADVRDARLVLLEAIRQAIRNGLWLLSIDAPEEM